MTALDRVGLARVGAARVGLDRVGAVAVAVVALAIAGCADPGPGEVRPYDRAPVPAVPDRTREVPRDGDLGVGAYWAIGVAISAVNPNTLSFVVVQATFDASGGVTVDDDPARTVVVDAASLRSVSVVADDRKNYAVPASELLALVRGDAPAHDAPAGYAFTDFPFLLTVEAGVGVEARQIWLG